MRISIGPFATGLLVTGLSSFAPIVAQKGVHEDERIGFSIKPPRGWEPVPLRADEEWIIGQFLSDEGQRVYHGESGKSWVHTPRMVAVALLDEVRLRADKETDEETGRTTYNSEPRYENYEAFVEEYLKNTFSVGYYVEDEGRDDLKGVPYRWMEIKAEGVGKPEMRVYAWVFELDIGDLAIQMDTFAEESKDIEKLFKKSLRSFKTIERTKPLVSNTGGFTSTLFADHLTPEKRKLLRIEQEKRELERMKAGLPEDWEHDEIDGVQVLNHSDDRWAKKVVEKVLATRRWLEDTFEHVGEGEYARMPILRICADDDEYRAMFASTSGGAGTALTTYKDTVAGAMSPTLSYASRRTMAIWFMDRDADIWFNMPAWLKTGLNQVVGTSSVRRGELEFNADWWEQVIKDYLRTHGETEPMPAREVMSLRARQFAQDTIQVDYDAMCLVRLLVTTKSRKYRGVLDDYLANLSVVIDDFRKEEAKRGDALKEPTNEEEEEAYLEAKREQAEQREEGILVEAISRTFAGWDAGDWKNFEKEFQGSK